MKTKLTAESVAAAPTTGKQYYITDTDLSRFALRVSATGKSKVFTYRADLPKSEENPKRRLKDIDLGRSDEISVREARKRASEIRGRLQQGWNPDAPEVRPDQRPEIQDGDMPYDVGCILYIKDHASKEYGLDSNFQDPTVFKTYPQYLREIIRSTKVFYKILKLENVAMKDITYRDVDMFHRIRSSKRVVNGKELGGKYAANRDCHHLRAIFNHAVQVGWIQSNPFVRIKYNKETPNKNPIPPKELAKFFTKLNQHHNFMAKKAVALGIMTGLRQKNILDLCWEDDYTNNYVNLEKREFFLRYHKARNRTNKEMIIPFTDEVVDFLNTLPRKKNNKHVFHSRLQSHINRKVYSTAFEFAKSAVDPQYDLESVKPNSTRHTFATNLINNSEDINLEDVADLLGHTSTAMVRKTYGKMFTEYRNKLRTKIKPLSEIVVMDEK